MLADVFDDEMTRELPSALRTTTDLDPFVAAPTPRAKGLPIAIPELTVVVAVMVLAWSCAFAGALGMVLGHTSEKRHPAATVTVREPRVAVVTAAHEAITEATLTAPSKQEQVAPPAPRPPAPSAPARRPGFQRPANLRRR